MPAQLYSFNFEFNTLMLYIYFGIPSIPFWSLFVVIATLIDRNQYNIISEATQEANESNL